MCAWCSQEGLFYTHYDHARDQQFCAILRVKRSGSASKICGTSPRVGCDGFVSIRNHCHLLEQRKRIQMAGREIENSSFVRNRRRVPTWENLSREGSGNRASGVQRSLWYIFEREAVVWYFSVLWVRPWDPTKLMPFWNKIQRRNEVYAAWRGFSCRTAPARLTFSHIGSFARSSGIDNQRELWNN